VFFDIKGSDFGLLALFFEGASEAPMTISALIKELESWKRSYGDLEVVIDCDKYSGLPIPKDSFSREAAIETEDDAQRYPGMLRITIL
jgi:hypothetical protein